MSLEEYDSDETSEAFEIFDWFDWFKSMLEFSFWSMLICFVACASLRGEVRITAVLFSFVIWALFFLLYN